MPKRTRDAIFETLLPYALSRSSISALYVTSINFVGKVVSELFETCSSLHRCIGDLVDLEVEFESDIVIRPVVGINLLGFDAAHESGHADIDTEDFAALRFN